MNKITLFFLIITITSCITKKPINLIKPIEYCEELPNININFKKYQVINNLNRLSFAQAYHRIQSPFDSLSLKPLRIQNQNLIKEIIIKEFPNIEIVYSERLQNMDYKEQLHTAANLIGNVPGKGLRIRKLVADSEGDKQLYIELVTNLKEIKNPKWHNFIRLYVFDNKNYILLYNNGYTYNCDPRDTVALQKVIEYGLRKLKADILQ